MHNELSKLFKECDICQLNATCLCYECNFYFCESCYKLYHSKQNRSGHNKESIDHFIPIDLKCPEHPKDRINLFCLAEKGNLFNNFIFRNVLWNVLF